MKKIYRIFVLLMMSSTVFGNYLEYLPKNHKGELVHHKYYSLSYAEKHEQSAWVMYELDKDKLKPLYPRINDFREDPHVSTYSAGPDDYKGSGYDRGHLIPAGSMKFSKQAMSETFFMSNISPQHKDLNRELWRELEEKVREWARNDKLYIVTGPILKGNLKKIKNNISVPNHFFKVIYKKGSMIAFLFPNKKVTGNFMRYAVTVDEVERASGLDFFSNLPDHIEKRLEARKELYRWPTFR